MEQKNNGFRQLTKEELQEFKIIDGYKINEQCYNIIIQLPPTPNRYKNKILQEKAVRFLTGVVWTFPFTYQLNILNKVIDAKIFPNARKFYIEKTKQALVKLEKKQSD